MEAERLSRVESKLAPRSRWQPYGGLACDRPSPFRTSGLLQNLSNVTAAQRAEHQRLISEVGPRSLAVQPLLSNVAPDD